MSSIKTALKEENLDLNRESSLINGNESLDFSLEEKVATFSPLYPFSSFHGYIDRKDLFLEAPEHKRIHLPKNKSIIYAFAQDEEINFDSYLNSFYEDHIARITGATEINLRLFLNGDFKVELLRYLPHKKGIVLYEKYHNNCSREDYIDILTEIPKLPPQRGRLALRLTALSNDAALEKASWGIFREPNFKPHLALVSCTYNKEKFIKKNIEKILTHPLLQDLSFEVVVVDNASSLSLDDFPKSDKIHLISQANIGGAGGFGRGMLEVAKGDILNKESTHILLLDDDVEVLIESFVRTYNLLAHAIDDKVCIGGTMFDLYFPTTIYEVGATTNRDKPFLNNPNMFLRQADKRGLSDLNFAFKADYNAWWFFAFPTKAIQQIGISMPVFIHVDDIEYSNRLRMNGYKIYCPAGICIWHEPFYTKYSAAQYSWMVYYDYRNHLIFMNDQMELKQTPKNIIRTIDKIASHHLLRKNYAEAAIIIKALEDYLKGPSVITEQNTAKFHKSISDYYKSFFSEWEGDLPITISPMHDRRRRNIFRRIWRKLNLNGHLISYKKNDMPQRFDGGFHMDWRAVDDAQRNVLLHDPWTEKTILLKWDRDIFLSLWKKKNKLIKQYKRNHQGLKQEWLEAKKDFTSLAFWEEYIAKHEKDE